jgi:K+-sensing histidine kinase KdpD
MKAVERIPQVHLYAPRNWQFYLADTIIALISPLLITAFIWYSNLYPRIPSITMVYLLLIVLLSVLRSRYAAIFGACVSFLAIDFFLIPPLYTLAIGEVSGLFALLVFLAVAIISGHMAGLLRRRAEASAESEHKLRILYELLRVYNMSNKLDEQLDVIALSTARVFSAWGVTACAILLPDERGKLVVRADAPIVIDPFLLTPQEQQAAQEVLRTATQITLNEDGIPSVIHLIPLCQAKQTCGVLCLRVRNGLDFLLSEENMQRALDQEQPQAEFFCSYLSQITALIERAVDHTQLAAQSEQLL